MIWKLVSPEIWTTEYAGWIITKIGEGKDRHNKELFLFIATKEKYKYEGASWEYVKRKILNTKQLNLF